MKNQTCWLSMALLLSGCAAPHEPPATPTPRATSASVASQAADSWAPNAHLPSQQLILVDRDEAPLALVQAACSARALTIIETADTESWGRVSAHDAGQGQVVTTWELMSDGAMQSWMLHVSATGDNVMQPFVQALHAARTSG